MDLRDHPSISRLAHDAKRHAPILVFGSLALLIVVSTAVALAVSGPASDRDARQVAAASPSPRVEERPSASAAPSPSMTPVPPTPAPAAAPDLALPDVTPSPEPAVEGATDVGVDTDPVYDEEPIDDEGSEYEEPVLEPEVSLLRGGSGGEAGYWIRTGDTVDAVLELRAYELDPSDCLLTQSYEPDDPSRTPWTVPLEPYSKQTISLTDGRHTFNAECWTSAGGRTATVIAIAMDQKPEACRDFEFVRGEITVSSLEELEAGVVGTWRGCVMTPWTPMYEVSVTLREDGTYSAATNEVLDGNRMIALYYGSDADSPSKLYAINDFRESRLGVGQLDISFGAGQGSTRDSLRNVRPPSRHRARRAGRPCRRRDGGAYTARSPPACRSARSRAYPAPRHGSRLRRERGAGGATNTSIERSRCRGKVSRR